MGGCSELVRGCLASEDEEGPACLILPGILIWEVQVWYRALPKAVQYSMWKDPFQVFQIAFHEEKKNT